MRTTLITTLAVAACAATLATGPAAQAATSRPATRLVGDCRHAQYEPAEVIIACGDGGIFFRHLHYTSWTDLRARATGQLWVNTDDPDAAAGHYDVQTVHVTFDRPKAVHGHERFSRATVAYRRHGHTHHQHLYPPVTGV